MKQTQHKKKWVWGAVVLSVMSLGVFATTISLASTVHRITENTISKTPNAILANAKVGSDGLVQLPVMYYDQRMDECVNIYDIGTKDILEKRQFEWNECGYNNGRIEQGLVSYELNERYLPTAVAGRLLPNRGIDMTRWFDSVDGKSAGYAGMLELRFDDSQTAFLFDERNFYPLDDVEFSDGDIVNKDGHNHLFTMSFAVPFTVLANGTEEFSIEADDDTFVYIDNKLAIDMGGIHDAVVGKIAIRENGEVYTGVDGESLAYSGINVPVGEGAIIRVFHADRDSWGSQFGLKLAGMNLNMISTELAGVDESVQIAYDPSDPTYVPPLGESTVFRPDTTRGLMILTLLEGISIVIMSVLMMYAVKYLLRRKS